MSWTGGVVRGIRGEARGEGGFDGGVGGSFGRRALGDEFILLGLGNRGI